MLHRSQRIDALRGLAISGVVAYHFVYTTGAADWIAAPAPLSGIFANGWAGVDLFFVLSAYLLTRNLLRQRAEPGAWMTFYRRRVLRIMPAFLALLALGYASRTIWLSCGGSPDVWLWKDLHPSWVYLVFLQNIWVGVGGAWVGQFFAPTWSLAVEEHFYLVLPLLVAALSRRALVLLAVLWIVTAPLIRLLLQQEFGAIAAYTFTIARLDAFGWGMLVALLPHVAPALQQRLSPRVGGGLALTGFALLALAHRPGPGGAEPVIGLTLMAASAACAVFAVAHGRSDAGPRPVALLAWIGQRCYSLYLLHMPVLGLTFLAFGASRPDGASLIGLLVVALAAALTCVVGDASYRFIERPFMAMADQRGSSRVVPAAAA